MQIEDIRSEVASLIQEMKKTRQNRMSGHVSRVDAKIDYHEVRNFIAAYRLAYQIAAGK